MASAALAITVKRIKGKEAEAAIYGDISVAGCNSVTSSVEFMMLPMFCSMLL